jgi:urease alpha subunit
VEILDGKRFVTCHSYVQQEINMLMHVADSMGWKMNTFTHILEGYKVADKMAKHGVSGSTFSDWWAYKYEVIDAIPYNAALMHDAGVNVGINSDDAEMGRRLNQEAAKGVKYGGMSQEDAWKMVTLNPAKMLKLDNRTGSLKAGKDADVVVWSNNPLSVYAKAEQTYVDGVLYYSIEKDEAARVALNAERNRIIQKMIAAKKGGAKTNKPSKKEHLLYHCDTMED